MSVSVQLRRAYVEPGSDDGYRVLVDRIWPRGVSRESLHIDEWLKETAPSDDLRHWFGHSAERWEEFQRRYRAELEARGDAGVAHLVDLARQGPLTLVFGARDEEHNNAVVLRDLIMERTSP